MLPDCQEIFLSLPDQAGTLSVVAVDPREFRERLRRAVERVGRKVVLANPGITEGGLSKVLSGDVRNPGIFTVLSIVEAANETLGALLGESGFDLTADDQAEVRRFVRWADDKLLRAAPPKLDARDSPNASAIRIKLVEDAGRVSPRRGKVAPFRRTATRLRAAATPDRELYDAGDDLPEREIPLHYWELGARLVFKAEGDSMSGPRGSISDRDLLFVRPEKDARAAKGKIIVCRVAGSAYVKRLDVTSGTIRLLSENERYKPMEIDEDSEKFELIGVVVGRSGYPPE